MRRLFTVGCSFTSFYWPTWADILGSTYDEYYNWGLSGLGNRAICERLAEISLTQKLSEDDTVIVQWTDFHRHDIHYPDIDAKSNWRAGGNIWVKEVEMEWVKDFWNESSYVYHSLNFIHLGNNLLDNLPCETFVANMIDINDDLEKLHPEYKTINQDNWLMPFATFVKQENYKGTNHVQWDWDHLIRKKVIKTKTDLHPTPYLYLKWCEQEFDKPFQSRLIEKIRQKDWTTVDTSDNQLYEYLDWTDSKYRVRGK